MKQRDKMFTGFSFLSSGFGIIKVVAFLVPLLVGTGFMKSCVGSGISNKYARAEVKNLQGILADNINHQATLLDSFETHSRQASADCRKQLVAVEQKMDRACALAVLECTTLNDELLAQASGQTLSNSRCLPTSQIPAEIKDILELGND